MLLSLIYSSPININKSLAMLRPSSVTSPGPCRCDLGIWGTRRRGPHVDGACGGASGTQMCPGADAARESVERTFLSSLFSSVPFCFFGGGREGERQGQDVARCPWVGAPCPHVPAGARGCRSHPSVFRSGGSHRLHPAPRPLAGGTASRALLPAPSLLVPLEALEESRLGPGCKPQVLLSVLSVTQM